MFFLAPGYGLMGGSSRPGRVEPTKSLLEKQGTHRTERQIPEEETAKEPTPSVWACEKEMEEIKRRPRVTSLRRPLRMLSRWEEIVRGLGYRGKYDARSLAHKPPFGRR